MKYCRTCADWRNCFIGNEGSKTSDIPMFRMETCYCTIILYTKIQIATFCIGKSYNNINNIVIR